MDDTWTSLTDLERIAPCLPGAELQEIEGDEYRGVVKVKVGPMTAQYKGTATFVERDDMAHRAVLKASGRDTRGQGNASAVITAALEPAGAGTKVDIHTDLTITGKVAQFGRGVLDDVSNKILTQFVENLERDVLSGEPLSEPAPEAPEAADARRPTEPDPRCRGSRAIWSAAAVADDPVDAGPRKVVQTTQAAPIDLIDVGGAPMAKRLAPDRRHRRHPAHHPVASRSPVSGAIRSPIPFPPATCAPTPPRRRPIMRWSRACWAAHPWGVRRRGPPSRADREPVVIRNAPALEDGTPMPTRYWLVGDRERIVIGRLEAAGGVRRAEAAVDATSWSPPTIGMPDSAGPGHRPGRVLGPAGVRRCRWHPPWGQVPARPLRLVAGRR